MGRNLRRDDRQNWAWYKNDGEIDLTRKKKMWGSIVSVGIFFCLFSSALSETQERLVWDRLSLRNKERYWLFFLQGRKNILCDDHHLHIHRQHGVVLSLSFRHRHCYNYMRRQEEENVEIERSALRCPIWENYALCLWYRVFTGRPGGQAGKVCQLLDHDHLHQHHHLLHIHRDPWIHLVYSNWLYL